MIRPCAGYFFEKILDYTVTVYFIIEIKKGQKMQNIKGSLSIKTKIGYGIGGICDNTLYTLSGTYLLLYLTTVAGVSPAIAGTISAVGSVWEALVGPIIGSCSDGTVSRFGKRKPFMMFAAIPIAVVTSMLFTAINAGPAVKAVYYTVSIILFWTFFSMEFVPYMSWGADLTDDYHERTVLRSYAYIFNQVGMLIGMVLPTIIVDWAMNLGKTSQQSWQMVGMFCGISAGAALLISALSVKKGDRAKDDPELLGEKARRQEEAHKIPLTGDPTADSVITRGQDMMRTIRQENIAIPDETLSRQMDTLSEKCEQIFRTVSEAPAKAPQVRKFMDYYLPTTLKMLANYRTMQQRGVSYQEMSQARDVTVRGMNMILTACQKQIDNLHRENMLDISTDIDVLEQMLKRDGYTENEIWGNKDLTAAARTAAEEQMRHTSAPVMQFPVSDQTDAQRDASAGRYQSQQ